MGNGTELGRVRGLGSAKEGTHHWWNQRLTAGSNLFLMLWLVISVARLPGYDAATVQGWIASVFYHMRLGLQVLIEDYAHAESRVLAMVVLNFFVIGAAAIAIFSILRIAFTAGVAA